MRDPRAAVVVVLPVVNGQLPVVWIRSYHRFKQLIPVTAWQAVERLKAPSVAELNRQRLSRYTSSSHPCKHWPPCPSSDTTRVSVLLPVIMTSCFSSTPGMLFRCREGGGCSRAREAELAAGRPPHLHPMPDPVEDSQPGSVNDTAPFRLGDSEALTRRCTPSAGQSCVAACPLFL